MRARERATFRRFLRRPETEASRHIHPWKSIQLIIMGPVIYLFIQASDERKQRALRHTSVASIRSRQVVESNVIVRELERRR